MARWTPVVFRRCACTAGACPREVRFEPQGRTPAAIHVVVHQAEPRRSAAPLATGSGRGLPFLLLGFAALLLATLDTRVR